MGRAIVREPVAFLMDEPLSNLDAKLRVQMRAEIQKLHQRLGTTTMYVTHDQTEAITMADRVAVMRDGQLQQLDTPQALYDDPANLFVAGFIGSPSMNLVRATLSVEDGRVFAGFGTHRLLVPGPVLDRRPGARAKIGAEVILGVRPEDLEDAEFASRADPDELLEVTIALAEPLGSEVVVHFEVDTPPVIAPDGVDLAGFTARLHPRTAVRSGRTVKLAVDVERLHLFDPYTGASLR
jgi:multiple sugar transport system ATP-binding protein